MEYEAKDKADYNKSFDKVPVSLFFLTNEKVVIYIHYLNWKLANDNRKSR